MTQFPLSPIYVGKIDDKPSEHKPFKERMFALWGSPEGLRRIAAEYPYRVCPQVGDSEYKGGFLERGANRLFQNAVLDEMCCGIRYNVDGNNKVRVTINLGGEYLFPDPDNNTFMIVWIDPNELRVKHMFGNNGEKRFHEPESKDLMRSSAAEIFFAKQRSAAGLSDAQIRAVRRDTTRAARADQLKF